MQVIFSGIMLNEVHQHQIFISKNWSAMRITITSALSLHPKKLSSHLFYDQFLVGLSRAFRTSRKSAGWQDHNGPDKSVEWRCSCSITSMLHLGYDESYKPLMGYQQVLPPGFACCSWIDGKKGKYLKQFPKASVKSLLERGEGGRLCFKCDGKDPQAFTVGPHACELTCQRINREI